MCVKFVFEYIYERYLKISVSGSNPHIHNPGGDPVPGMPYNFIQSGLKKNWI